MAIATVIVDRVVGKQRVSVDQFPAESASFAQFFKLHGVALGREMIATVFNQPERRHCARR